MSTAHAHDPAACPNCGYTPPPVPQALKLAPRPLPQRRSGRQVSFRRGVRAIAAYLADVEGLPESSASLVAERELAKALPARQRSSGSRRKGPHA